ncbi:putative Virulence factor MviN-like protein [Bradyrhizobium sp. STM 3843]|uniref:lipid II flippase MurJ n=1 Tax=Bradyrhizobium sp. STM 3843 TaxID=551947 RepID=UPI000240310E|nr:lipid II flippase MurJ [Bradyrhizobium sp. STM 3843]CCE11265.1 putative Virulence factor MviN-like protein [Bradyrhizobium sp. STM 3843]
MSASGQSLRRFSALLISGALASKLLGFAREVMMAHVLGASLIADGFRSATTAVLIPLAFLQNESVPAIMIPMHREALQGENPSRSLGALTAVIALISALIMLAVLLLGEIWVNAIVGGFSVEGRELTLRFVRMMAFGMPASAVLNVLAAGEIALGRTRLTNLRASLLNVAVLAGIALLMLTGNAYFLACAFTIAFNVLALWGLYTMWREGVLSFSGLTVPIILAKAADFFRRLRVLLALPLAEQGNIWIERLTASRLTTGAVASLDYARSLTESALLLISQPLGMAVLSHHAPRDPRSQLDALLRPLLALTLPASAFLLMFSTDIVRLIYFRGAFGDEALLLTSHALKGIACGVWAATLGWILIRLLNGAGRNGAAALIIVCGYLVNIGFNLLAPLFAPGPAAGMQLLGIGEALRSIVLLLGVVLVLGERRKVLTLIGTALVPALLMMALGQLIQSSVAGLLPRLLVGGCTYLVCLAVAVALLMPTALGTALRQIRRLSNVKGQLS